MLSWMSQRIKIKKPPEASWSGERSLSSQLQDAEEDERSLRRHVHLFHDERALNALRQVRARIADWQQRLRSGASQ